MRTAAGGLAGLAAGGDTVARRAMFRWGWRLFRREWRQQLLVFGLLTVAVAALVTGSAVAVAAPGQPGKATFGSATAMITLPGSDPRLAVGIAAIRQQYGPGRRCWPWSRAGTRPRLGRWR